MTTPSPERNGVLSNSPSGETIAVKLPPDIGPIGVPVSAMICAC